MAGNNDVLNVQDDRSQVTLNASDIQIGNVEIKDDVTGTTANVITTTPAGTEAGLITRNIPSGTQPVSGTVTDTNSGAIKADLDLRFSGGKLFTSGTLSTAGDNVVITPAAGKQITVYWVALVPNSDNTAANLCQFKFNAAGSPFYTCYAIAHWEPFQGAANQTVIINLTNTQPVAYTIHYSTT